MTLRVVVALLAWTSAMSFAQAQQWPSRPVTLVSPDPPGGTNDFVGRLFADRLAAKFGQPIVVENRAVRRASSARSWWRAPRPMATPC